MGVGPFLRPDARKPVSQARGGPASNWTPSRRASPPSSTRIRTFMRKGFEETPLPKDFFDAAIGNIPFGNYPVYDPAYRRSPHLTRAIHDYFLAKSLDKVRPGGVMALITSRYTMDKQDSAVRRHLADAPILIGAIRLPNTAFKANAGTEVTTDILFLQKRSPEMRRPARAGASWLRSTRRDGPIARQRVLRPPPGDDAGPDGAGITGSMVTAPALDRNA